MCHVSAGSHDVIMVQVLSVTLTSQADNPLPRVVLHRDLYRKAVSSRLTSQPGAEMEDRQYQLDITGESRDDVTWERGDNAEVDSVFRPQRLPRHGTMKYSLCWSHCFKPQCVGRPSCWKCDTHTDWYFWHMNSC